MSQEAELRPGSLPVGYCYPSNPQVFYNDMFRLGVALLPDNLVDWNFGPDEPVPELRGHPWLRTIAGVPDSPYIWSETEGRWIWPYPVPPSSPVRWDWVGAEADLTTFDGGTNVAVANAAGPFWEVDHDFDGRIGIGPGNLPGPPVITINVGDVGGADRLILSLAQLLHFHGTGRSANTYPGPVDVNTMLERSWTAAGQDEIGTDTPDNATLQTNVIGSGDLGTTDPLDTGTARDAVNIMPPYRGIWKIKRTARIFRTP